MSNDLMLLAAAKKRAAAGSGDPYFANVVDVWNFATNATGVKGTVLTLSGSATVTGGYLNSNGAGGTIAQNSGITALGSGDFCIEWFAEFADSNLGAMCSSNWATGAFVIYKNFPSGKSWSLYMPVDTNNPTLSSTTALSLNTKHHFAISRSSGTVNMYQNGTRESTASNSDNLTSTLFCLLAQNGAQFPINGKIYAYRYTVGSARGYTGASITVPTDPFPES